VARHNLAAFAARFDAIARARLGPDDLVPVLKGDLDVSLTDVTDDLARLLRHGEPWGVANPTPVFVSRRVELADRPRILKGEHLKLAVADGARTIEGIGWHMANDAAGLAAGDHVDLAYQIERDIWQGRDRLQLKLAGVRRAS
jgi:single-stranded-DNA-specific exonuclease